MAGSTQQYLTLKVLRETPVFFSPEIIIDFFRIAEPLRRKIIDSTSESQNLAKLRDTLLPKLISGELEINDINLN